MLRLYNSLLEKHPMTTKCLTSGFLFSLGDIFTQMCTFLVYLGMEDKAKPFDYNRNINFFAVGSLYIAPNLHLWYCKVLPKIG
jgi:protein Mpv17